LIHAGPSEDVDCDHAIGGLFRVVCRGEEPRGSLVFGLPRGSPYPDNAL